MKARYVFCFLCAALFLSGCLFSPESGDTSAVTLGSSLTVDNTDSSRTLLSSMDTLAASGLYYASWGLGETEEHENNDGKTVSLYDAQIYLLLGEYKNNETAADNMQTWLDAGRTTYEVISEEEIRFCGQTCTKLTYRLTGEDALYSNGISVFGVFDNEAVCIELTCRDTFAEDPEVAMDSFLDSCTYVEN